MLIKLSMNWVSPCPAGEHTFVKLFNLAGLSPG